MLRPTCPAYNVRIPSSRTRAQIQLDQSKAVSFIEGIYSDVAILLGFSLLPFSALIALVRRL